MCVASHGLMCVASGVWSIACMCMLHLMLHLDSDACTCVPQGVS